MTDDSEEWVSAREAVTLLKPVTGGEYSAQKRICARAGDGLIRSRAAECIRETRSVLRSEVVASQTKFSDYEIPADWWSAACINPRAQNWSVGDFDLGNEDGATCRAYGVQFARADITMMVPASSDVPQERAVQNAKPRGTKIFIGHGGSPVWYQLKDFIANTLKVPCDEFNATPSAGLTIAERLEQMLGDAAFAFLVLTAEDEGPDGSMQARMNVVHEAGLFQGRLGFKQAIVLLEEGCEKFSNIDGLVHIAFPAGKIKYIFEEVRGVLHREGLVP